MFIVIRPSTETAAALEATKNVLVEATIVPNGGDLDGLMASLKVGDEVYTVSQKRIIEAQPPIKFGEPIIID